MALLQTSLIWIVYAIVIVVLAMTASIFINIYQTPRDRSSVVNLTCIVAITSLLATLLLLPVDVALVSSTTSSTLGQRKSWATPEQVNKITSLLTVIYYILYSVDASLCFIVIPFVYFWYEEYDEVAAEAGEQSAGKRLWTAFKYTISFIAILAVVIIVGLLVPIANAKDSKNPEYLRKLLAENRGERALAFAFGLLITIGLVLYVVYTSSGLALLPIRMIGACLPASDETRKATTAAQLDFNRERQGQLEGRCRGNPVLLSSKDRRELDALVRDERTLIRRQRIADEARGEGRSLLIQVWLTITRFLQPFKLLGGIVLAIIALMIWLSMLLTAIDKAKNSVCKHHCGYILSRISVFNPVNWAFVQSAKVFPVDYAIFILLVLLLFCSSVIGISTIGIRFLWIQIFRIRKGHTSPQALLSTTGILILIILALEYSVPMLVAPQYATFGPQTFCDRLPSSLGNLPNCSNSRHLVKPCSEETDNVAAKRVCTPTIASTFLNRVTINFPFFGTVFFWSQFIFLAIFLLVFIPSVVRPPRFDERLFDQDAEEAEEESLLSNTGIHVDATWHGIIDRAGGQSSIRGTRE
ncbi:putative lysosomal cobalamin transporter [Aspergillus heteromorphus CBS 117.55]|uniref:Probable lysosomal cobalamin transporter n=1 Tax=Aspergillus heteromorphus CBS 117.55 TaxID=1448321 RepID=A0A317VEU9_9EURO|nr:putative lysosomal cobalamin transporter [Aspergillus heteromorphus CBS 117.55]PWY71482.1 putative lysosomal cobalamin transporter [Aspergillus heteromorphus CBS 117.55]